MSDFTSSFSVLPWTVPTTLQNFAPECSRIFSKEDYSIYICWRGSSSLLFTFRTRIESLSSETPIYSQAITCKHQILDIVEVDHSIFFVSRTGLFQTLHSKGKHSWEIFKNLRDCKSFSLADAFELSPLKRIKSVITFPVTTDASLYSYFVAITHSEDSCKIDAELYTVSHGSSVTCQLQAVTCISNCAPKIEKCFSTFLTHDQVASLFCNLRDAEILLIGLDIGQLYYLPIYILEKKYGIKPSSKLIYQSKWPVVGISCPKDGFNIYLYLEGGTVVNISPLDKSGKLDHSSLCYSSFTLSYPIKFFSAPKYDVIFVSDAITTSEVHIVTSSQVDIQTIPVKGITSLTTIPSTSLVLASTFHNSFYLLHHLNLQKKSEDISPAWAGCSLDVSLQLVEDMKAQTRMLSHIKQELLEENHIINALSTVARAHLLADHFSITAKVSRTFREQERKEQDQEVRSENCVFQIAIEIRNNSPEEFDPFLWLICIDVKNPDGQTISKNIPLNRAFNKNFPFSTLINIPYQFGKFRFPVYVVASLIGNIKDIHSTCQWLKIRLNEVALDVSHFFTVSMHAPQPGSKPALDIFGFLNQLQDDALSDAQRSDLKRKALSTSYTIPIPEEYRQPDMIVEKLLSNCHHNQKLLIERDFYNQSEKTVIWLYILHETVELVFRKSCTSISITCCNLELLHTVKLSLANMFIGDVSKSLGADSRPAVSASVNAACCKARNINAVLETLSLEEVRDVNQLLDIYQDLRNNVSSQIY